MSNDEYFDCSDILDDLELTRLNYPGLFQRLGNTRQPQITQSPHCIYRTPKLLRMVNEAAYTPRLVSIGPYHYGNEDLQMMENIKNRYLINYLRRTKTTLEDILSCIKECKEELKSYYAEKVTLSDTSFVEMMLLDGVFIIELFLRMYYPDLVQSSDVILLQSIDIKNDLFFMLENQLPLFFIEKLYKQYVIQPEPYRIPFFDLALFICSFHVPWHCSNINMIHGLQVNHLHDLLRTIIITSLQSHPIRYSLPSHAYCLSFAHCLSATELHEAGVKFKVRESLSFLDIIFDNDNGVLYMPSFIFDRNTETFIRNLMAYEQCHYHSSQTLLGDYLYLMDSLINTSKDMDVLVKNGIIINWFGDNIEVATLVNNLSKIAQIDPNRFYYAKLCEDLDRHCKNSWNYWKATFKRDYLSTPWKVASTIAAIILLLLTLIQTVCSLVSLFK